MSICKSNGRPLNWLACAVFDDSTDCNQLGVEQV